MIRLPLCVLALVALVSLAGPRLAAEEPTGLKGTYATTLMDEKWTITFGKDNMFTVKKKDEVMVEGTYKASKDQVEFTDKKGPIAAPETKVGKYQWKLEGKKLTFTKVEDDVKGREAGLTTSPWTAEE